MEYGLGCVLSPDDDRDYLAKDYITMGVRPNSYFPDKIAPILNQGSVCSCVPHTFATMKWYHERRERHSEYEYSTDYTYHDREDTDHQGHGMIMRQAAKNFVNNGTVLKSYLPSNTEYPNPNIKSIISTLEDLAIEYKSDKYIRSNTVSEICEATYQYGACAIAIPVKTSFMSFYNKYKDNCILPIPKEDEQLFGYHAICVIGYDEDGIWIQNSWGKLWGWNGIAKIPYDYPISESWTVIDYVKVWDIIKMTIDDKHLYVNGNISYMDVSPFIIAGRTFIPARYIAESLGAKVSWNHIKRTVTITFDDINISLTIDNKTAQVNGETVQLDTAPLICNNRTYVPLRFVAEQLGADVEYIDSEQKIIIRKERKA